MGETSLTALKGFTTFARTEDPWPRGIRLARYPDGSERVQGAYFWSEGLQSGITWRDLPIVEVRDDGQAV